MSNTWRWCILDYFRKTSWREALWTQAYPMSGHGSKVMWHREREWGRARGKILQSCPLTEVCACTALDDTHRENTHGCIHTETDGDRDNIPPPTYTFICMQISLQINQCIDFLCSALQWGHQLIYSTVGSRTDLKPTATLSLCAQISQWQRMHRTITGTEPALATHAQNHLYTHEHTATVIQQTHVQYTTTYLRVWSASVLSTYLLNIHTNTPMKNTPAGSRSMR